MGEASNGRVSPSEFVEVCYLFLLTNLYTCFLFFSFLLFFSFSFLVSCLSQLRLAPFNIFTCTSRCGEQDKSRNYTWRLTPNNTVIRSNTLTTWSVVCHVLVNPGSLEKNGAKKKKKRERELK